MKLHILTRAAFCSVTLLLLCAGCVGVKFSTVDPGTPSIALDEKQNVRFMAAQWVEFPAGIYEPHFQNNTGIFYKAPGRLVTGSKLVSGNFVVEGGLFVPHPGRTNRMAVWFNHQNGHINRRSLHSNVVYRLVQPLNASGGLGFHAPPIVPRFH